MSRLFALGATALVIVLDQFTRNLIWGTPRACAGDALAIEVAARVVAEKADRGLSVLARLFLYHPFHHAESVAEQDRALALFANLARESPPHWSAHLKPHLDAVREHRTTVHRFGRFPHRNEILGRSPTAAETAYLLRHSNAFGQRPKEASDDS